MKIQANSYQGATLVAIVGEIDGHTAPEAHAAITPLIHPGANILLDMERMTYLSSAGLRILLLLYREALAQGARIVLVGMSDEVEDVMKSTGFLKFFRVAETREAAVALLSR